MYPMTCIRAFQCSIPGSAWKPGREATLYRLDGLPNGYSVAVLHGSLERHRMGHILTGPGLDTLYPSQRIDQSVFQSNLQPTQAQINYGCKKPKSEPESEFQVTSNNQIKNFSLE